MPAPPTASKPPSRQTLPIKPTALDLKVPPSPRHGHHPLLAPPRPIIPSARLGGAPSPPTVLAAISPAARPQLQVFDLSALPAEPPRTPRAPAAPPVTRRRKLEPVDDMLAGGAAPVAAAHHPSVHAAAEAGAFAGPAHVLSLIHI